MNNLNLIHFVYFECRVKKKNIQTTFEVDSG